MNLFDDSVSITLLPCCLNPIDGYFEKHYSVSFRFSIGQYKHSLDYIVRKAMIRYQI